MTAIAATFADFRPVKSRGVYQIILEVPAERANDALIALGGLPLFGSEQWVGVAPLVGKPQAEQPPVSPPPSPEKVKAPIPFRDRPRSQQAAIRINDPEFRRWWAKGADASSEIVNGAVKRECGVNSKRQLNTDMNAGRRWDHIEDHYQQWRKANRPVETEERA